jgi:hypothetical protein
MTVTDKDTATRLDAITVPEIDFRSAAMSDVVLFLHEGCLPVGYSQPPVRQSIGDANVTYFIPVPPPDDPTVKVGMQGLWEQPELARFGPSITLSVRHISMLDLFRRVAEISKSDCEVQKDLVVFKTKKVQQPTAPPQEESAPKADPF